MINLDALRRAPAQAEPFPFLTASGLLDQAALSAIAKDFPAIPGPGIFPLEELEPGPAFRSLIDDIRSPDLERILEQKLGVELADKPLMITVRGHCQRKDGRIHTDSTDKVVTCLLYLNTDWQPEGGRLRLLRSGTDMEDMIAEVAPDGGNLIAFRRTDNSWHGHLPFEGPRRYVMFNWVRSGAALSRNVIRHRLTAKLKRFGLLR